MHPAVTAFALSTLCLSSLSLSGCGTNTNPDKPKPPQLKPENKHISFESGSVRPIAQSSDGKRLFVTNTVDNRVEILQRNAQGKWQIQQSLLVGMEPVALALRNDTELWVVNHLSDSVSIIELEQNTAYIKHTLLVGDEPRDIVFAQDKAFITTAHRGQQRTHASLNQIAGAGSAQIHQAGIGRADVWVFDATKALSEQALSLAGKPEKIINLFADTPRALAVSPDQNHVYAAAFHSGNQTSVVHEAVICDGFTDDPGGNLPCPTMDGIRSPNGLSQGYLPGARSAPGKNKAGEYQPWTSMIVQYDNASGQWQDSQGRNFSNGIRFNLPDQDVFKINTTTLNTEAAYPHIGTTLFNMAVHPQSGELYVSNTESNNATRFEGPGDYSPSTVQGNLARSRISIIKPDANTHNVGIRPLNWHIDYQALKTNTGVKQHSIATPTQLQFDPSGQYLYVAALGSNKIAVYNQQQLASPNWLNLTANNTNPAQISQHHIEVAGGPAGLLLDKDLSAKQGLIYALTRFDNALVVLDASSGNELQRIKLHNPEPSPVQAGRRFLYDAQYSSSNGETSCASCHTYGDNDQLAWNLGNPDAPNSRNPQPFSTEHFSDLGCLLIGPNDASCQLRQILNGTGKIRDFASMKGPMMTQTLRGMSTHGHMHWRGDRSNGYFGIDDAHAQDEKVSFKNFIVAFEGLLGLDIELPATVNANNKSARVQQLEQDIDSFADFALAIQMPPNPLRGLDNSYSDSANIGRAFFNGGRRADGIEFDTSANGPEADGVTCQGCHAYDPSQGFYGSGGEVAHGGEIQIFKVPQFRNLYTRVGMFGLPDRRGFLPSDTRAHQGAQVRGFGFLHDGATDSLFNFLKGGVFDNGEQDCAPGLTANHGCEFNAGFIGIPDDQVRQGLVDFVLEFDSDLAPVVGQQISLSANSHSDVVARIQLLQQRADTAFTSKVLGGQTYECDLIVSAYFNAENQAFLYQRSSKLFMPERLTAQSLTMAQLQRQARQANNSATFSCVPPGSGLQFALDRDLDGYLNGDEIAKGSNPSNAKQTPATH